MRAIARRTEGLARRHALFVDDSKKPLLLAGQTVHVADLENLVEALNAPLASDYRVADVNGRPVIMHRKNNVVVAEFSFVKSGADDTAHAVDFFETILGR